MAESASVYVDYLRGQLAAAHSAIRSIWHISVEASGQLRDDNELRDAILEATKLLPSEVGNDETLVGETYWYHPESDCFFVLSDGDVHPAAKSAEGAQCVQISKSEFDRRTSTSLDDFL